MGQMGYPGEEGIHGMDHCRQRRGTPRGSGGDKGHNLRGQAEHEEEGGEEHDEEEERRHDDAGGDGIGTETMEMVHEQGRHRHLCGDAYQRHIDQPVACAAQPVAEVCRHAVGVAVLMLMYDQPSEAREEQQDA